MNIISKSIKYITRKKTRSLILLIILSIILSSVISFFSVSKYLNLYNQNIASKTNASFNLLRKDGNYFDKSKFNNIKDLKDINDINYEYKTLAKLKNHEVYDQEQSIRRENLDDNLKNVVNVLAISESNKDKTFNSEIFKMISGNHLTKYDNKKVLIHEKLANKNNLKVGDEISLNIFKDGSLEKAESKYIIKGIYTGKTSEKFTGLSSDFTENNIFMSYRSLISELDIENNLVSRLVFFTNNTKEFNNIFSKVESLIKDEDYYLEKNTFNLEEINESMDAISLIINKISYITIIGGIIILSLILILWIRNRIHEIGIYLSIGISKIEIISQFIIELIIISIPSLLISLFLSNGITYIMNKSLLGDIKNSITIDNNILNFNNFDLSLIFRSYIILFVIIVISVILASTIIISKKPKQILSNIS